MRVHMCGTCVRGGEMRSHTRRRTPRHRQRVGSGWKTSRDGRGRLPLSSCTIGPPSHTNSQKQGPRRQPTKLVRYQGITVSMNSSFDFVGRCVPYAYTHISASLAGFHNCVRLLVEPPTNIIWLDRSCGLPLLR